MSNFYNHNLDSETPTDTTTIASHRNNNRTWGGISEFTPITPMAPPQIQYDPNDDYVRTPTLPQPSEMSTPMDNLTYMTTGQHPTQYQYDQQHNQQYDQQYDQQQHNQQHKQQQYNQFSVDIPLLTQRDSLLSILSNRCFQKCMPHLNDKYHNVIAPYSIYYLLLIILVGATSHTFTELASFMGMTNSEILPPLVAESTKLHMELIQHKMVKLNIHNGFFADVKFQKVIQPKYRSFINKIGHMEVVNFANTYKSASQINNWVKDRSRGLVSEVVSPNQINDMTQMVIVNTIYFKSRWQYKFDKSLIEMRPFRQSSGLTINIPLMYQTEIFDYIADSNYKFISLPYQNPNFVMDFILPNDRATFPIQNLDQFLESYQSHQRPQEIKVYIPKFEQQYEQSIRSILEKNGVSRLFKQLTAELFNIGRPQGGFNLSVADIIHKTVMIVDEESTEAFAVTAATMIMNAGSNKASVPVFKADRTFQYMLRYQPTNTILFAGVFDGN